VGGEINELRQLFQSAVQVLWGPGPILAVQNFFGPDWSPFFNAVAFLATIKAVMVVVSLALWLVGRRLAYSLVGVVLLAAAVDSLLWSLIGVPRPNDPRIVVRAQVGVSSFPSGHVVTSTVVYGLLAARDRIPVAVPLVLIPAIMISRLYLGVHYLGDVLGGLLIGLLLLALFLRAWPKIAGWLSRLPLWLFLVAGLVAPFGILLVVGTSPRGWALLGVGLAAGIGLTLEYRYVRFDPGKATLRQQALKAAIGLGEMGVLLLAQGPLVGGRPFLGAVLLALAVLWGVLGAPALFARMGLSRPAGGRSSPAGRGEHTVD
jgi:membrane-associated phospholipid phosphatase